MPRIRAIKRTGGSVKSTVRHKRTKFNYTRPRDCELKHLGRTLQIEVEGDRGSAIVVLKGREINSLMTMLERVGEFSTEG